METAMAATRMGALPRDVSGISIDSRTIAAGEAFFAIKGDTHDGHGFVAAARKNGAGLAVVGETKRGEMPESAPQLVVPDVLAGLVDLGRAARARANAKVIAVTGSVGKTSTKDALRLALSRAGETHASLASFNNQLGVPLSLARLPDNARYGGFERGRYPPGEQPP